MFDNVLLANFAIATPFLTVLLATWLFYDRSAREFVWYKAFTWSFVLGLVLTIPMFVWLDRRFFVPNPLNGLLSLVTVVLVVIRLIWHIDRFKMRKKIVGLGETLCLRVAIKEQGNSTNTIPAEKEFHVMGFSTEPGEKKLVVLSYQGSLVYIDLGKLLSLMQKHLIED